MVKPQILILVILAALITGGILFWHYFNSPEESTILPEKELPVKEIEEIAKPTPQICTDGTLDKQCSPNKPQYCNNGNLVNKCSICGCFYGKLCNIDGNCVIATTLFRYYDICWNYDCSSQHPPYPKLLESQRPKFIKVNQESFIPARDNIDIIVVFLYDEDLLSAEDINALKNSYQEVETWFAREAAKHGINLNINIEFSESQFKVPPEYVIRTYEDSKYKNLTQYIKENLPQFRDYDVIVSFYYGSYDFQYSPHVSDRDSFELFGKQSESGFSYLSSSISFAHELTHLLGATDKYTCLETDTSSESCVYAKNNGIGCWVESDNPDEQGRDIMCHRVLSSYDEGIGWTFTQPPLDGLKMIEVTAKEIGWYDADGDGILEVNDPCPFNSANNCF